MISIEGGDGGTWRTINRHYDSTDGTAAADSRDVRTIRYGGSWVAEGIGTIVYWNRIVIHSTERTRVTPIRLGGLIDLGFGSWEWR